MSSIQESIAEQVRILRRQRHLTQKELASYLNLSQNRLSQIEAGNGSFSAEHLLLLAKKFNVNPSSFAADKPKAASSIQNALIRLGAGHLREDESILPSEALDSVIKIVREVLNAPESQRALAALATVIVRHAEPPILNRLRLQLKDDGLIQRYGWLLENTQIAIQEELKANISLDWRTRYEKANFILKNILASPWLNPETIDREDILDYVVSQKTLDQLKVSASEISRKWNIITRVHPRDFTQALKEAREAN